MLLTGIAINILNAHSIRDVILQLPKFVLLQLWQQLTVYVLKLTDFSSAEITEWSSDCLCFIKFGICMHFIFSLCLHLKQASSFIETERAIRNKNAPSSNHILDVQDEGHSYNISLWLESNQIPPKGLSVGPTLFLLVLWSHKLTLNYDKLLRNRCLYTRVRVMVHPCSGSYSLFL